MRRTAFLLLGLVNACSGSDDESQGRGTMSGTIGDQTLSIGSAISAAFVYQDPLLGELSDNGVVVMSTSSDICGDLSANVQHPNEVTFVLQFYGDIGMPIATGDYEMRNPAASTCTDTARCSTLQVYGLDAACQDDVEVSTMSASGSGGVVLASTDDGVLIGSYDIMLISGDRITGDFEPVACSVLPNALLDRTPQSCE
jgi:hypothetical protein